MTCQLLENSSQPICSGLTQNALQADARILSTNFLQETLTGIPLISFDRMKSHRLSLSPQKTLMKLTFFRRIFYHILWHISGFSSDLLSVISSDIFFWCIFSRILSGIYSHILSGKSSDISYLLALFLAYLLTVCFWQSSGRFWPIFWHSFWHVF